MLFKFIFFICLVLPVYMCKRSLVQPCGFKSCVNGTCHNNEADHTATCECDPGFMGSLCQYSIDDCTDKSCVNGDCVDDHMSTTCRCWPGVEGNPNICIHTYYHNSNLIWRTVSRQVDEIISSDHQRRVASRVIQWYGLIHET